MTIESHSRHHHSVLRIVNRWHDTRRNVFKVLRHNVIGSDVYFTKTQCGAQLLDDVFCTHVHTVLFIIEKAKV